MVGRRSWHRTVASMDGYGKQRIALRYWLLGAGFHKAAEAMDFAEQFHTGTRKDGVTPEFAHQVQIAHYLRTQLASVRHPEETLTVALLHDVREDHEVSDSQIRSLFGNMVADAVDSMTKEFRGHRRDDVSLFERMAANPVSSMVKPADRINNQGSMVGVFTTEKMSDYVQETKELFLPMLKSAKRSFPDQEAAYEAAKLVLVGQIDLVEAVIASRR